MRCVDVNVLVYAHRADLPEHEAYRERLIEFANDDEPLGLADAVLSGFVRVITNGRIFNAPTVAADAWARVDELLAAPAAVGSVLDVAIGTCSGSSQPRSMRGATTWPMPFSPPLPSRTARRG